MQEFAVSVLLGAHWSQNDQNVLITAERPWGITTPGSHLQAESDLNLVQHCQHQSFSNLTETCDHVCDPETLSLFSYSEMHYYWDSSRFCQGQMKWFWSFLFSRQVHNYVKKTSWMHVCLKKSPQNVGFDHNRICLSLNNYAFWVECWHWRWWDDQNFGVCKGNEVICSSLSPGLSCTPLETAGNLNEIRHRNLPDSLFTFPIIQNCQWQISVVTSLTWRHVWPCFKQESMCKKHCISHFWWVVCTLSHWHLWFFQAPLKFATCF